MEIVIKINFDYEKKQSFEELCSDIQARLRRAELQREGYLNPIVRISYG